MTDLRGFDYALQPLLQRSQHRLDLALYALAEANSELVARQRAADELRARLRMDAHRIAAAAGTVIDPNVALAGRAHMATLQRSLASAQGHTARQRQHVDELEEGVRMARLEVEKVKRHRQSCADEYAAVETRREQTRADQEWTSRHAWAERHGVVGVPR